LKTLLFNVIRKKDKITIIYHSKKIQSHWFLSLVVHSEHRGLNCCNTLIRVSSNYSLLACVSPRRSSQLRSFQASPFCTRAAQNPHNQIKLSERAGLSRNSCTCVCVCA